MLQVTEQAKEHLAKLRRERHVNDASARLIPGRSGEGVKLTFSKEPARGDRIVRTDGLELYVAEPIAKRLDRSVIDIGVGDRGGRYLTLRGQPKPNPVTG